MPIGNQPYDGRKGGYVTFPSRGRILVVPPTVPESELKLTFRQFLSKLWRRRLTIVVCTVVAVAAALGYSKLQKVTYQSSAVVQLQGQALASAISGSSSTSLVNFPNPSQEVGSAAVQKQAAKLLGPKNAGFVASDVSGTVSPTTGALTIVATDTDPARARLVAQAYATAFVDAIQGVAQAQITKIQAEIATLTTQISTLETEVRTGSNPAAPAELTAATTTYGNLQTDVTAIQFGGPYAVVQTPAGAATPTSTLSKAKLGGIGLLAGLLVGGGVALVQDQLDTRLRDAPDIEAVTEAPILAELPMDPEVRSGKVAVAVVQSPHSPLAESVRELRTSLRVILEDKPCPLILVTSPAPGDGKTFVAANLAAAWAMTGSRVVVVSADFRRPQIERIFGLRTERLLGLSDFMTAHWRASGQIGWDPTHVARAEGSGSLGAPSVPPGQPPYHGTPTDGLDQPDLASLLVKTSVRDLYVLPAGGQRDRPSELFDSPGMQAVLEQLPDVADVVLWDTPPVLAVPDAAVLGRSAHGVVVVTAEGQTDREALERTVQRLEATRSRIYGIVLNRVRHSTGATYHPYYDDAGSTRRS